MIPRTNILRRDHGGKKKKTRLCECVYSGRVDIRRKSSPAISGNARIEPFSYFCGLLSTGPAVMGYALRYVAQSARITTVPGQRSVRQTLRHMSRDVTAYTATKTGPTHSPSSRLKWVRMGGGGRKWRVKWPSVKFSAGILGNSRYILLHPRFWKGAWWVVYGFRSSLKLERVQYR